MEPKDLDKYGNLPQHVRQALLATEDKDDQPSTPEAQNEQTQPEEQIVSSQEEQPQQSEQHQIEPPTATQEEHESNDVKSWKGRLNKEQEAHKSTNARLLEEAEARKQAEQQAKEAQDKLTALQQQLEQQKQPTENQPPQQTVDEFNFSPEEEGEVISLLGATGKKLMQYLRQTTTATPVQPSQDVGKIVDERLQQMQQQQAQQTRQQTFMKAVNETIPELQGLMTNSAFHQFLNEKVVDFYGNTAAVLVEHIGKNHDIDKLPQFRKLVDEFNQSQQPPKQQVTAPPSNPGAAISKRPSSGKKKLTPEVESRMRILMNTGQVDELRKLQEEYDFD
ncbi:hypothetical protein ACWIYZ_04990 [Ursidibacter arcticus]